MLTAICAGRLRVAPRRRFVVVPLGLEMERFGSVGRSAAASSPDHNRVNPAPAGHGLVFLPGSGII